ncbi:serine/threonine protein phosphatase 1 [Hasllibacter halocynthiae]|uniref:Serine/threonine protein phosphatase 1 n=1 Tax=Hasllibacter halocynthiae TaxID=595589 RepID=A0A2T0X1R0_9RHOB|nr:metallophosphoesterase [Hasllibacter halocynthiae]PRY92871.1 serine/threonine protein phosphatase 1 [Hasllibacter halocynthiae]
MTGQVHAIGDVHGHLGKLDRALTLVEADGGAGGRTVLVGDLVDRGPDGRAVIERLMRGQAEGRDWTVLLGNHDRFLLRALRHGSLHEEDHPEVPRWRALVGADGTVGALRAAGPSWLSPSMGGAATLASYGVDVADERKVAGILADARRLVPESHLDRLEGLPLLHEAGDLLFVHAGIRPGVPLSEQDEEDLVWIRHPFLDHDAPMGRLVVHGHTPERFPVHYGNRVAIDAGAAFGRPLVPVAFEGTDAFTMDEGGRTPLRPPEGAPNWR